MIIVGFQAHEIEREASLTSFTVIRVYRQLAQEPIQSAAHEKDWTSEEQILVMTALCPFMIIVHFEWVKLVNLFNMRIKKRKKKVVRM